MGVRHMLERRLELNGGLMTADLGVLRPDGGGQILECSLRLEGLLPERRVALELELLEGDACRGVRMITLPPHHLSLIHISWGCRGCPGSRGPVRQRFR